MKNGDLLLLNQLFYWKVEALHGLQQQAAGVRGEEGHRLHAALEGHRADSLCQGGPGHQEGGDSPPAQPQRVLESESQNIVASTRQRLHSRKTWKNVYYFAL